MESLDFLTPPKEIAKQVERLRKITGFVTILHKPHDTRPLVFARYYHVRRVAWLSNLIAEGQIKLGINIDLKTVFLLAWALDLNRWPFSHNSEKGFFSQSDDISRYIKENNLYELIDYEKDLERIISKEYNGLSEEGKIVLFADIITGFIEDPLWATTALNISIKIIPKEVSDYLRIPVKHVDFLESLYKLNILFAESKSFIPLIEKFDSIFKERVISFIEYYGYIKNIPLNDSFFEGKRKMIKEEFMIKIIFSYNNEKI